MFLGFIDSHTAFIIMHLFGVVLGAGGAVASDAIFFSSVKDGKISKTELRFLKLGSRLVWVGLFILVLSGVLIFFENPEKYMNSTKFLAKMSIIGIIILNGIIFHITHIPHLNRHEGKYFPDSGEFRKKLPFLMISGVVSMVSWLSALILGSLSSVPYPYSSIMYVYLFVISFGILFTLVFKYHLLPVMKKKTK